jgi:hypothetical protein
MEAFIQGIISAGLIVSFYSFFLHFTSNKRLRKATRKDKDTLNLFKGGRLKDQQKEATLQTIAWLIISAGLGYTQWHAYSWPLTMLTLFIFVLWAGMLLESSLLLKTFRKNIKEDMEAGLLWTLDLGIEAKESLRLCLKKNSVSWPPLKFELHRFLEGPDAPSVVPLALVDEKLGDLLSVLILKSIARDNQEGTIVMELAKVIEAHDIRHTMDIEGIDSVLLIKMIIRAIVGEHNHKRQSLANAVKE